MRRYTVVWRPRARADLLALYDWIAESAGNGTAFDYTSGVEARAASLAAFPERGAPRDDLVPGMRTTLFRRRTIIAYRVIGAEVEILRLVHAGRDWDGGEED